MPAKPLAKKAKETPPDYSMFYSREHHHWATSIIQFRQLEDYERVRTGDIIWWNGKRVPGVMTSRFYQLMLGAADRCSIDPMRTTDSGCYLGDVLKRNGGVWAKDIVPLLIEHYYPSIFRGININDAPGPLQRDYSIWRTRIILPRREWQDSPLPLP